MDVSSAEVIQEATQTIKTLPEGVGENEDSGFASIAGTENPQNDETPDLEELARIKAQRMLERRAERMAASKVRQEQYNEEKREKTYKHLLHLVSRSKFYANYLVKKLNPEAVKGSEKSPEKLKRGGKRKAPKRWEDEGDVWGAKKTKSAQPKNLLKNTVPTEVKKQVINEHDKLNANQEDFEDLETTGAEGGEGTLKEAFIPPKYFVGDLRDYQQEGLQWLKALYENGMSGILADEMGLGKTIQAIAMIAHLIEHKQAGPFLIVAPLSTIPNWLIEFERFAPQIPVVFYYGNKAARDQLSKNVREQVDIDGFKTQPVILTTYEVPLRDKNRLRLQNWRYLVIDEGHRIKNSETQLAQLLQQYKSMSRLLLTGTPLQNEMKELWSLLNFLMPNVFDDLNVFESWLNIEDFQNEEATNRFLQQEQEKKILQSFREIVKPFMLRRMKADVCLDIPPKKEVLVYAPMTKLQHNLYSGLLNYDLDVFFKTKNEPLIIDDEFGNRPKRKCAFNNKYSAAYRNPYAVQSASNSFDLDTTELTNKLPGPLNSTLAQKEFEKMKQYADINEVNRDYFMKITFGSRGALYRKIINHPYLIHLPLNDCGLPKIDEDLIKASGKMMVLDRMLLKLNEGGHRVLLFSTITTFLDVIEDYLMLRPWKYLRLDGTVDIEDRKESIKLFNTDPGYFIFLVSTRAGGVGLNLMGADTVIIIDNDWNPQADIQAMARCHRIGQTRPVVIYRLCTKGSYDEVIVNRAQAKRTLEKLVISKEIDEIKFTGEGLLKLKKILESNEHQTVDSQQEVFTEEELNTIMDRSDLIAQMHKPDILEKKN